MVKIIWFGDEYELDEIPNNFIAFKSLLVNLLNIQPSEIDSFKMEYTHDTKNFTALNEDTYLSFGINKTKNTQVIIKLRDEDGDVQIHEKEDEKYQQEEQEQDEKNFIYEENNNFEKEKEDELEEEKEINTNQKQDEKEENLKFVVPEITKEMVIASIVKKVKTNIQNSKIQLEKKNKEEEKKKKKKDKKNKDKKNIDMPNQINNIISDRLDNLKEELINESQIKISQIVSESQINLDKGNNNQNLVEEKKCEAHSMEEHPGFKCSKCGLEPIKGVRYCCVFCNDVNYCEKCEEEDGFGHGHPFYKLLLRVE